MPPRHNFIADAISYANYYNNLEIQQICVNLQHYSGPVVDALWQRIFEYQQSVIVFQCQIFLQDTFIFLQHNFAINQRNKSFAKLAAAWCACKYFHQSPSIFLVGSSDE